MSDNPWPSGGHRPFVHLCSDGPESNIFVMLAQCRRQALAARKPDAEIEAFHSRVNTMPSYDAALAEIRRWFDVTMMEVG